MWVLVKAGAGSGAFAEEDSVKGKSLRAWEVAAIRLCRIQHTAMLLLACL